MASRSGFLQTYLFSTAGIMVMALLIIGLNFLAGLVGGRVDLTEDKLYTLSAGTYDILDRLESPVTINFYYSGSSRQMPMPLKNYAQRVDDLLKEYRRAARGRLEIRRFDPEPLSDEADAARLDGVQGQNIGAESPIYFGISVQQLDRTQAIPFLHPQEENMLEYKISRAIYRVTTPDRPVVGIMSSLPVMGEPEMGRQMPGMQQNPQRPWYLVTELRKDYELRQIPVETGEITEPLDVLLLIHPHEFSQDAWFTIDQYVLGGGRLLALIDPLSVADPGRAASHMMGMQAPFPGSSDLGPLLDAWGLTMNPELVVADLVNPTRIRNPQTGQPMEIPTILSLAGGNISDSHPATAGMDNVILAFAGAIEGEPVQGLTAEPLIYTSPQSDLVSSFIGQAGPEAIRRNFTAAGKPYSLAVLLHGEFPTAFPNGRPGTLDQDQDDDQPVAVLDEESPNTDELPERSLTSSVGESAVIIITDSDIATDNFSVQIQNLFGQQFAVPISDNIPLLHNLIDLLSGDTSLMLIRGRAVVNRRFEVVNQIRARAEQAYQAKISQLEDELARVQQRLRNLQQGHAENHDQQYFITPEQLESIREFEAREVETRQELREVQRQLRKDIDSLETRLKWINIALTPTLVGIGGIVLAMVKRRKEARI